MCILVYTCMLIRNRFKKLRLKLWFFVKQAVEQWVHKGLLKPILEKYDKDVLREVIEEILRDDMSFEHTKMKLEKYKEKSI